MTVEYRDLPLGTLPGFYEAPLESCPCKNADGDLEWILISDLEGPPGPQGPQGPPGLGGAVLSVADIDDPVELNSQAGTSEGETVTVFQIRAGQPNYVNIYSWDPSGGTENVPITVDGSSGGTWVLVGGYSFEQQLATVAFTGEYSDLLNAPDALENVVRIFNCDVSAAIGDLVYQDPVVSGKVLVNTDNTQLNPTLGVIRAKPTTTTCEVLQLGTQAGFAGLAQGQTVFLSTSGGVTTSAPVTGYQQQLGTALSTTEVFFIPNTQRVLKT